MAERGILMSAPMVRAILSGSKSQTRRVVKPQPDAIHGGEPYWHVGGYRAWRHRGVTDVLRMGGNELVCPLGVPGDRLWVRESFSCSIAYERYPLREWGNKVWYWADGIPARGDWTKPRPSIHMPRSLSRITLEITDIRVARLQGISDADAVAEGVQVDELGHAIHEGDPIAWGGARGAYSMLWDRLNGDGSWEANPWVWVISFGRRLCVLGARAGGG